MVSDSELIDRLRDFLRNADLDNTSITTVRRQLETDFGINLSDRKSFIRDQINLFFKTEYQQRQNDDEEEASDSKKNTEEEEQEGEEEEDDDDNEEEEEEEKPKRAKSLKKNNKKGGSNKLDDEVVKKKGGGFCKLCSLSPQLQEFVGVPEMARTEVVKQLWVYIKEKNLQDPDNRRNIICDEPLRGLFGVNSINMFQMNKALTKHIWQLDSDDAEVCHIVKRAVEKKLKPIETIDLTKGDSAKPGDGNSKSKTREEVVAKMKELFRKTNAFTADDQILYSDMINVESLKATVEKHEKVKDLLRRVETMKVDVDDWGFVVKKFPVTSDGILSNVKLNSHSPSSKRDIIFNGVLVKLADMELFTGIEVGDVTKDLPADVEGGGVAAYTIDGKFISLIESIAKIVMVATLYSYCQGIEDRSLKWYESFQNVCGSFISESRLVSVMKAIHNCGTVSILMETMTVGEIKSYNNVFTYRLRRYSSPSLVKQALSLIHTDISALCFDLSAVQRYRNFEEAGDLAQIASGPLKVYCKGKINPLKITGIPDDLELVHLQRIDEPPYHEHTIRRAKMILDIFGVPYGRWYQGMRAEKTKTSADIRFEALIKRVHAKLNNVKDVEAVSDAELRGLTLRIVDGEPEPRSLMGDVVLGGWVTEIGEF